MSSAVASTDGTSSSHSSPTSSVASAHAGIRTVQQGPRRKRYGADPLPRVSVHRPVLHSCVGTLLGTLLPLPSLAYTKPLCRSSASSADATRRASCSASLAAAASSARLLRSIRAGSCSRTAARLSRACRCLAAYLASTARSRSRSMLTREGGRRSGRGGPFVFFWTVLEDASETRTFLATAAMDLLARAAASSIATGSSGGNTNWWFLGDTLDDRAAGLFGPLGSLDLLVSVLVSAGSPSRPRVVSRGELEDDSASHASQWVRTNGCRSNAPPWAARAGQGPAWRRRCARIAWKNATAPGDSRPSSPCTSAAGASPTRTRERLRWRARTRCTRGPTRRRRTCTAARRSTLGTCTAACPVNKTRRQSNCLYERELK